ncbi:MAG: S1/P1 nuclease [Parachlamydiaceae bacterium]|nr:S1/P1 nuclease [Parachlamydiaceae bacterium]
MKKWFLYFIIVICLTVKVHGWWDVPHMLVAQIAKDNIEPKTCERVEELLSYFKDHFPKSNSIVTAACFPDDITSLGLSGFKVWHGMLTPYCPDHYLSEETFSCIEALVNDNNILSGINQSLKTLRNPSASKWEKCFLLRFLLHCVADIHQPLHCIQMYSKEFPSGDFAGHRFTISEMPYADLHQLWDAAFGIGFKRMKRPLSDQDALWIKETADFIATNFQNEISPQIHNMNISEWSQESYQLAIDFAYTGIQPGDKPSQDYLDKGERIALRQIALAGFRLGTLLEELFGEVACGVSQQESGVNDELNIN